MTKTATTTTRKPTALQREAQADLERALDRLPFSAHLSFEPLFSALDATMATTENEHCRQARPLIEQLKAVPALRGPISDPDAVADFEDGVRVLLSFVFPELTEDEIPGRAWSPFAPGPFFVTPKYRDIFDSDDLEISSGSGRQNRDFYRENLHAAYWLLYRTHYGDPPVRMEFFKRIRNKSTGLDRFFLLEYNYRFVEVDAPGLRVLPEPEYRRLLMMDRVDELVERLPLDDVTFSGFCFQTYVEVTELQNISMLKTDLVEPDALTSPESFEKILRRLRSLIQVSDLEAGMALRFSKMNEQKYCTMHSVLKDYDGCIANIEDTIYGEVIRTKEPLLIPDLTECDCDSAIVQHMRAQGIRSLSLVPLIDEDNVIGLLELSTPRPEELTTWTMKKLADLTPPLTVAVRRLQEEVVSRVERTIKTHCTAIHPSVEWRFEDAAYRYNRELDENGTARFEPIVFENVHPLYGAMDIRGSSESRNRAIQADLLEHLDLARHGLAEIYASHPMPIADYYDTVLERFRASVAKGLNSGDELSVIEFLHTRVEPFFNYVRDSVPLPKNADDRDPVEVYFDHMDPGMGILYKQRKQYEDAVALINDTLVEFVDREQEKAQAIFPHYFEKFKTDGVEHSIYVGQSMTHDQTFDEVQLKNLRLWQLQLMCGSARIAENLVDTMNVKLRTTPLVLAQSSPLTIQFSPEEKQFAVEGSYNIRYEIIKKRIDKATIVGTSERLTQPGKLALIYTQDKEGDEYRRYFEYLAEKGFLRGEVENLELSDLQGVHGLRALRAEIVLDDSAVGTRSRRGRNAHLSQRLQVRRWPCL